MAPREAGSESWPSMSVSRVRMSPIARATLARSTLSWTLGIAIVAAAVLAAWLDARVGRLPLRDRIALSWLRAAALALLVVCLAGPVLLVATAVPRRNVVAVLIDDSRSMAIADTHDTTRFAAA